MKISIALATYNGSLHLEDQLNSYLLQTVLPYEVVVCDDLSNDLTWEILKRFKKEAPFKVELYRNKTRLGYAQNFSKVLDLCTGDIILLSDQDDVWFPYKIEEIIRIAKLNPNYHVFFNDALLTNENLNSLGISKLQQLRSFGNSEDSFVQGSCCAIRKIFLNLILPVPTLYNGHDNWIGDLAILLKVKLIIKKSLQYYRLHGDNTSSYFVNQQRKLNIIDKVRIQKKTKAINCYNNSITIQIQKLEQIKKTLHLIPFSISADIFTSIKTDELFLYLSKKQTACFNRNELITKSFIEKLIAATNMLIKRDYHLYFNGLQSYIKDVFFVSKGD